MPANFTHKKKNLTNIACGFYSVCDSTHIHIKWVAVEYRGGQVFQIKAFHVSIKFNYIMVFSNKI